MKYTWTKEADYFAYCLYKTKNCNSNILNKVADFLGCKPGSLKMRIKNFEYLDTNSTGLSNYAKQSKEVYLQFQNDCDFFIEVYEQFRRKFML